MDLLTMWVRLKEFDVVCIISVRDFNEKLHEDLGADGNEPKPLPAEDTPPPKPPPAKAEAPQWPDIDSLKAPDAIKLIRATDWSHDGIVAAIDIERGRDKPRKTVLAEASRVADQLSSEE